MRNSVRQLFLSASYGRPFVKRGEWDYLPVAVRHALREAEERRMQKQRLKNWLSQPTGEETPLLPICATCKKIRDKQNHWKSLESFFLEYLNIRFTHGICPDCFPKILSENYRCDALKATV
jgi:hypothetical protein